MSAARAIEARTAESLSPALPQKGGGSAVARDRARALRRSATETEKRLWRLLRAKRLEGWKFRQQYPIGQYIVDFACPAARLIIEADGSQHAENDYDLHRDAWLLQQGWQMLRFWNNDILTNEEGVLTAVLAALSTPLPNPSPTRGEGLHGALDG